MMLMPTMLKRMFAGARRGVALVLVVVAGCSVGPPYQRPRAIASMPATYASAGIQWKLAQPAAHVPKGPWWEIFNDAELNRLEAQAAEANQQLRLAVARFAQARANANVARSGWYPRIDGGLSGTRQQSSENRPNNQTGQAAGNAPTYDNYVLPFDFSYEVDLWGRVRRQVEAAEAAVQADAADLEAVRLAIAAEVAADYFAIRALDAELQALHNSIQSYRKSLELIRSRRAGGLASDLDVAQAETVLNAAEAQVPALQLSRAKFVHALAVLLGQPASVFQLPESASDRECPVVEAGVPSELLERRPDIAAAEQRVAAANAEIGVAKAAYFPSLRIHGLAGLQSVALDSLVNWPSHFWGVGPTLTVPIFQGGRLKANERAAQAAYEAAVARYRQTVLAAFAEVEDNLAAQRLLEDQYQQESRALASARKQLEIASHRYEAGLVSYLHVVTAQSAVFERERLLARLRGQRFIAGVALVKSLGGGWSQTATSR